MNNIDPNKQDLQPTLTLDPFARPAPTMETPDAGQLQRQPEQPKPVFDESKLTEEERRMVNDFASQIDLTNSTVVLQYGAGAQKKMADFSESALENVRTKDLGEIGQMLTNIVGELKNFDEEEEKGFLGFFKKSSNRINNLKAKYAKAEANINQIVDSLENHMILLLKDVAMLDKMYEINKAYFKELSMYILAGQKKLAEVRQTQLAQMIEKARQTNLPEDAQAANDLANLCDRFEKKLHDLELTRMIAEKRPALKNEYIRLVQPAGNPLALSLMDEVFQTAPSDWRGLGQIRDSGYALREKYRPWDAWAKFGLRPALSGDIPGCRCAEVIRGTASPVSCPLFGRICTPEDPAGPCMVSGEGACAAAYQYGNSISQEEV